MAYLININFQSLSSFLQCKCNMFIKLNNYSFLLSEGTLNYSNLEGFCNPVLKRVY